MGWQVLEAVVGALGVAITLLDVFLTIIVPGRASVGPRTAAMIRRLLLPVWTRASRWRNGRYAHQILSTFPGVLLVSVFLLWLTVLLLGFAAITHALGGYYEPKIGSYFEALFETGLAAMTLGLSGHQAHGWGRLAPVLAGLSGLLVVTLTLTYILQTQSALQRRDPLALLLPTRAGSPPSGVRLLVTMQELGLVDGLGPFFGRWEDWAGTLLDAYNTWPVLIYFRSKGRDDNWLASLNAVLDASVLVHCLDAPGRGEAQLFYRAGIRLTELLCQVLDLEPSPDDRRQSSWAEQLGELTAAGYCVDGGDHAHAIDEMRKGYEARIRAIGRELDLPLAASIAE